MDHIPIDVLSGENRKPDFLAINPEGTLPVLELDDGSRVYESLAIIEYLEEVFTAPDLGGSTPLPRAKTREMAQIIAEAYSFFNRVTGHANPAFQTRFEQNADIGRFMKLQYVDQLGKVDRRLSEGAYVCGDQLTYADCMLFASAQFAALLYKSPIPA